MGWSSRDNNLRKNTSSNNYKNSNLQPKLPPVAEKVESIKTDLSGLDERSTKNIATLHPKVQPLFKKWILECQELARSLGYEYKAISGNRSWDEQAKIYAQGRTAPGKIVTNAKPGYSNHNYGIAVDMGVFKDGKYLDESKPSESEAFHRKAAELALKFNLEWGGSWKTFKDYPHFEWKTGKTLSELRQLVLEGKDIFS